MPIYELLERQGSFEPEQVAMLCTVFEEVLQTIGLVDHTGRPCVFVRKEAKEYGSEKAVEGPSIEGKRATIIEDVVTTGGAIIDAVAKLRSCGADVDTVVCAIWRGTDLTLLKNEGLELRWAISRAELERAIEVGSGSGSENL